jgi:hypothetical protein
VKDTPFTPAQRRVLFVMLLLIVVVFAALSGFIVTSLQRPQAPTPAASTVETPVPPTSPPIVATSLPTLTPEPEEGIWSQVQLARLLDQVGRRVETLRELTPQTEVPLNFLSDHDMTALLRQVYVERDLEGGLVPYTALGLLPDQPVVLRIPQVIGVYVPEQGQLYLTSGQQDVSEQDRVVLLAHAYGQALQDQFFDLEVMRARATTTDARLAAEALTEGDATVVAARYRYEDLDAVDWPALEDLLVQSKQPGYGAELDGDESLDSLKRFPYREGRVFVIALLQSGGWGTVDRAYVDPPRSTEQVLHPERYLAEERDAPISVFVPDLGGALGAGWTLDLRDTLGEFVLGLYVGQTLPEEAARDAAAGWAGDTFVVWQRAGGNGGRVRVWRTMWDSTEDAAEFEHALVSVIPQRHFPTQPLDGPRGLPGYWWESETGVVYVYRVARYVTLVEAPDVDTLANIVEALP